MKKAVTSLLISATSLLSLNAQINSKFKTLIISPIEDPPPPPVANPTTCTIPPGATAFGNLQGHIPSNCYGGVNSWWNLPKNGGNISVSAEACKLNTWYVSVVGEKFTLSGFEARTAGVHGMTGTPSQPVTINSTLPDYTAGTCNGVYDPFHGVKIVAITGAQNFSYRLLQERPINGVINKCEIGVYRIDYTPQPSDAGKIHQIRITAQILVTPFEYSTGSYIRESSQIDWIANISVVASPNCPQVAVAIQPQSNSLIFGETKQFIASVTGTTNTQVSWSTDGGSISASGLYYAPTTPGTFTVKATSVADPSKFASASVVVGPNLNPVFPSNTPTSFHSSYGQGTACSSPVYPSPISFQFNATDANNHSISYRIERQAGGFPPKNISLSLSPSGLFYWDGYEGLSNPDYYYIIADDGRGGVTKWPISVNTHYILARPCDDPVSN